MLNIHPMLVHFPIALLAAALFFDLTARLFAQKRETLLTTSWYTLLLGLAGLAAAVATGLWAENTLPHDDAIHTLMKQHKKGMLTAATLFVIAAVWQFVSRKKSNLASPLGVTVLMLAGFGVMTWAADLGGRMVYEHGAGTSIPGLTIGEGHDHAGGHEHGGTQKDEVTGEHHGADTEHREHIHQDGSAHQH